MTLKQWLKQTSGKAVKPGDPAWTVYTDGPGKFRIDATSVKTVGRTYLTTDDTYGRRYAVLHEDQDCLYEDTDWGYRSTLYLSRDSADAFIRRETLLLQFRQNWNRWIDQASLDRLETSVAILSMVCPESMVRTFLEVLRQEPLYKNSLEQILTSKEEKK